MRKAIVISTVAILALALVGCGGASGGAVPNGNPTATDVSQLPNATSPMASTSASISSAPKNIYKSAATGLNLLSATSSSFQSTDSMAGCQAANVIKDTIVSASQADQILCYVKAMNDQLGSITSGGRSVDVYDGEWYILNLNIAGEDGGDGAPNRVKMQIVKNADGNITSFKMYMCRDINSVPTQNEYTSQTLDGTTFAMHARGNFISAEWSGGHQVDVAGTVDASGAFTQKTITVRNSGTSNSDTNWQEATLTQTPGAWTLSGYQKGSFTSVEATGTYQEAAYGAGQMLGDTSTDPANLALGDGAVNVDSVYTFDSQFGSGSFDPVAEAFAWLGDSMEKVLPATDSSFYAVAVAGTIPTPAANFSITFDSDQTWDCNDEAGITTVTLPEVQNSALQTACSKYEKNHEWIDCFTTIGRQEMEQEQQQ